MMRKSLITACLMPFGIGVCAQDADTTTVTTTTTVYDCPEVSTNSTSSEACLCETIFPSAADEPGGTLTIYSTSSATLTITISRSSSKMPTIADTSGYLTTVTSTDTDGSFATVVETCWGSDDATGCMPLSTITRSAVNTFTSVNITASVAPISAHPPSCFSTSSTGRSTGLTSRSSYSFPTRTSTGSPASTSPPYVTAGSASLRSDAYVGSMLGAFAILVGVVGGFA